MQCQDSKIPSQALRASFLSTHSICHNSPLVALRSRSRYTKEADRVTRVAGIQHDRLVGRSSSLRSSRASERLCVVVNRARLGDPWKTRVFSLAALICRAWGPPLRVQPTREFFASAVASERARHSGALGALGALCCTNPALIRSISRGKRAKEAFRAPRDIFGSVRGPATIFKQRR